MSGAHDRPPPFAELAAANDGIAYDRRLDLAARAGWLYYVAGHRQEKIAEQLGVSRQTAQRLVAQSRMG